MHSNNPTSQVIANAYLNSTPSGRKYSHFSNARIRFPASKTMYKVRKTTCSLILPDVLDCMLYKYRTSITTRYPRPTTCLKSTLQGFTSHLILRIEQPLNTPSLLLSYTSDRQCISAIRGIQIRSRLALKQVVCLRIINLHTTPVVAEFPSVVQHSITLITITGSRQE